MSGQRRPRNTTTLTRRALLAGSLTATLGLSTAGCLDSDDGDDIRDDIVLPGETEPSDETNDTPTFEHDSNVPEEVREFLETTNAYNGTMTDQTGAEIVSIAVGADQGGLAFLPTAVRVDVGTTVRWEWTGAGGYHNVVHDADDSLFSSGETVDSAEEVFEFTFEDEGVYPYVCEPHWAAGMRGVIQVD